MGNNEDKNDILKDYLFTDNSSHDDVFLDNGNKFIDFFKKLFRHKKFLPIISFLILVFVIINVSKTMYLRSKVDKYEDFFTVISEKESTNMEVSFYEPTNISDLNDGAASSLVRCIKEPLNLDELPDSVKNIINEINMYYNSSYNYFAFKYQDLYTGFSVSYNENQRIFTASTIKAPKDIYLYEMVSKGEIDLSDKLTYISKYYNNGSGILKTKRFNTSYTVKELLRLSTVTSDNAAHNMLMDKYGKNNIRDFWKEKGANTIFTGSDNWGLFNAHDAAIYMNELYEFYKKDEIYGKEVMQNFIDAYPTFLKGKNGYKVANKSGWSGSAIHDVSIVFADNPYIVVALSNLGDTDIYQSYFNKANDFAYRLHNEYWKVKMNMCNNINQYK